MRFIDTTYRTDATEVLDEFELQGRELEVTLNEIASINQWLGGNRVVLLGVKKLLTTVSKEKELTIFDIGCGNGDMLRVLAKYAKNNGLKLNLVGVDANSYAIGHAKKLSASFDNISYKCLDIFSKEFKGESFDIALCTLTLHHFKDDQILGIIKQLSEQAQIGVIVNDLQRSGLAYRLFQLVGWLFRLTEISKQDGLVSILRGFKRNELEEFSRELKVKDHSIHWKWAFRYQWIIKR